MTLFDRMNGDKILPEAVKKFHTKVMKDASLAPFFEKLEPDAQIEHQKIFITVKHLNIFFSLNITM